VAPFDRRVVIVAWCDAQDAAEPEQARQRPPRLIALDLVPRRVPNGAKPLAAPDRRPHETQMSQRQLDVRLDGGEPLRRDAGLSRVQSFQA